MEKFVLLGSCLVAGAFLRRTSFFDEKSPIVLNSLIIYFFIPVITLLHIPKLDFQLDLFWLSLTPFIIYGLSFLFFRLVSYFIALDKPTEGMLIMTSGIGSISFVGFPIFELLYGEEGLRYGIVLSLAGTFVVFNSVGMMTGLIYSNQSQSLKKILTKIFTFPPLVCFVFAILVNVSGARFPVMMDQLLEMLAAPFSVLALLSIGMQLEWNIELKEFKTLFMGQFFKLIIAPFVIFLILWNWIGLDSVLAKVCILGAGIGSMNAVSIVAAQMGLKPRLAVLMPAIGIPLSIPLLFLIDYLIK